MRLNESDIRTGLYSCLNKHQPFIEALAKLANREHSKDDLTQFCTKWNINTPEIIEDVNNSVDMWQDFKAGNSHYNKPCKLYPPCEVFLDPTTEIVIPELSFNWDWVCGETLLDFKKRILAKVKDIIAPQLDNTDNIASGLGVAYKDKPELKKHIDWLFQKVVLNRSWNEIAQKETMTISAIRSAVTELAHIIRLPLSRAKGGRPKVAQ